MPARTLSALDLLLFLMTAIWGSNYAVVKVAFREIDPQAFNAVRMMVASAAFLAVLAAARLAGRLAPARLQRRPALAAVFHSAEPLTGRDWLLLAGLGLVGHVLYQFFFIGGLARSTVANSSLLLASAPVVIGSIAVALGHERVAPTHWIGAIVSAFGIYLVVGQGVAFGARLLGDAMTVVAVGCWALYTIGARPLMARHSPVAVTGLSMALGTLVYAPAMWPQVRATDWAAVSPLAIALLLYSALFSLCVAYTIWYIGVRQIGSARTAVYSNFVPIMALASAAVFLDESIGIPKIAGAAAVLAGVALSRIGTDRIPMPAEE